MLDLLHKDGFVCGLTGMIMGETGELLAKKYNIARQEQDMFSLESHEKANKAIREKFFQDEIAPIEVKGKNGAFLFAQDEIPRVTSIEKLAKLPTIFKKDGTVTAGNSCALCDGAAALVLADAEKAKALGAKPIAKILSYSYVALDPNFMGLGPVFAIPAALEKAGLSLADIDLIEINEAFAVQVLACIRELSISSEKINVYGGAIALGHPVGATGAKILTTLIYALKRKERKFGLAALCIGGGQGVCMIIENLTNT
jgi:acetyl-CoA C-acetyltransferase